MHVFFGNIFTRTCVNNNEFLFFNKKIIYGVGFLVKKGLFASLMARVIINLLQIYFLPQKNTPTLEGLFFWDKNLLQRRLIIHARKAISKTELQWDFRFRKFLCFLALLHSSIDLIVLWLGCLVGSLNEYSNICDCWSTLLFNIKFDSDTLLRKSIS